MIDKLPKRIGLKIKLDHETGCWEWLGYKFPDSGYGQVGMDGKVLLAHRCVYELCIGPITPGYELHHKCANKSCVNPEHCEPLPKDEHRRLEFSIGDRFAKFRAAAEAADRAITHCPAGHEYTAGNTELTGPRKGRRCRTCHRDRERARYHAKKLL